MGIFFSFPCLKELQNNTNMITVKPFVFNPFRENTYLLSDETKECAIIDAGCYTTDEKNELKNYITRNELKPVKLLNTHLHIDHILGNRFISDQYNLGVEACVHDEFILNDAQKMAMMFGMTSDNQPPIQKKLTEKDLVQFGNSILEIRHVPGHSPGSLVFLNNKEKIMFSGDVLFEGSVGRSDLPGGNHEQLIENIRAKLLTLDKEINVFPGHGNPTTIGREMQTNSFL